MINSVILTAEQAQALAMHCEAMTRILEAAMAETQVKKTKVQNE